MGGARDTAAANVAWLPEYLSAGFIAHCSIYSFEEPDNGWLFGLFPLSEIPLSY